MSAMGTGLFLICLTVTLLYYDVMLRVRLLLGPKTALPFMSWFQHSSSRTVLGLARVWGGFRLRVGRYSGGTLPEQCLVVCNHQSLADIPVLMRAFPTLDLRFVAKRELRRGVPGVSMTLRAARHALIGRRSGHRQAHRALRKLAQLCRLGVSPVVFPEGTRTHNGEVGVFQGAAIRILAETTTLPILSVAVDGGWAIARLKDIIRNLGRARYRVQPLTVYPPATTRAEVTRTLDRARSEIAGRLALWRSEGTTAKPNFSPEGRPDVPVPRSPAPSGSR
jgi:1-acyl-sn-glycerol-3-phosphate acyltransferase